MFITYGTERHFTASVAFVWQVEGTKGKNRRKKTQNNSYRGGAASI